jgi:hypothetical protein
MIKTFIDELNYILEGGWLKGSRISLISNIENSDLISFAMMGQETINIVLTFKENYISIKNKLIKNRIPHRIDLFIDTTSKSAGINYSADNVLFIDSPTLLNDISYEYNQYISKKDNIFLLVYQANNGLEYNEKNSYLKFLEVMQARTISKGIFFYTSKEPLIKTDYELTIQSKDDELILSSKSFLSEIFYILEPNFKVL